MSTKFRGQAKIVGRSLRGWLLNVEEPQRPVGFNLHVDRQLRGIFVAQKPKPVLMRNMPDVENAFGFEIRIAADWITGGIQEIRFEDPGDEELELVLRGALGPRKGEHFAAHQIGGEALLGAQVSQTAGLFHPEATGGLPARTLSPNPATLVDLQRSGLGQSDIGQVLRASLDVLQGGGFEGAIRLLKSAFRFQARTDSVRREMAKALGRLAKENIAPELRNKLILEQIQLYRELTQSADRAVQINAQINLATACTSLAHYEAAVEAADGALKLVPNSVRALVAKARALVPQNAIAEACALYERVVEIEPHNQSIRTTLRILTALAQEQTSEPESLTVAVLKPGEAIGRAVPADYDGRVEAPRVPAWICTRGTETLDGISSADFEVLRAKTGREGFARLGATNGEAREFWRGAAIRDLLESGLIGSGDPAAALDRFVPFYGNDHKTAVETHGRRSVIVTSRNGGYKFGGGEHFLESVAEHYAEQGYAPIILGTRPEFTGQVRSEGGVRYAFIEASVPAFRRFALENDVALVHAISGMGFIVAEALRYTNIPFIYGVHFWRELLGDAQDIAYFDGATGQPIPRKEFRVVLSRAAVVYANSRYTQTLIEQTFGVRCPIVYSVPREVALARE